MYKTIFVVITCIFSFACTSNEGKLNNQQKKDTTEIVVEFHFAQIKPGVGLTEKTIRGSSKIAYLENEILFSNSDIADAHLEKTLMGQIVVKLTFSNNSAKKLSRLTRLNIGKSMAITLNGELIFVAKIMDPIINGIAEIHGLFNLEEAEGIVNALTAN